MNFETPVTNVGFGVPAAKPGIFTYKRGSLEVFTYKMGTIEVTTFLESVTEERRHIFIVDTPEKIEAVCRYLPGYAADKQGEALHFLTSIFILRTKTDVILVDAGFDGLVGDQLHAMGLGPEDVTMVLISHTHDDHIGGLEKDGEALFPNAKVYIAEKEIAFALDHHPDLYHECLDPCAEKIVPVNPGTLDAPNYIAPGIGMVANYGHTPGHMVFLIEENGQKVLITGDLLLEESVQFPMPDLAVTYDLDPETATPARLGLLQWCCDHKVVLAGSHLHYPAMGMLERDGVGYAFTHLHP